MKKKGKKIRTLEDRVVQLESAVDLLQAAKDKNNPAAALKKAGKKDAAKV